MILSIPRTLSAPLSWISYNLKERDFILGIGDRLSIVLCCVQHVHHFSLLPAPSVANLCDGEPSGQWYDTIVSSKHRRNCYSQNSTVQIPDKQKIFSSLSANHSADWRCNLLITNRSPWKKKFSKHNQWNACYGPNVWGSVLSEIFRTAVRCACDDILSGCRALLSRR